MGGGGGGGGGVGGGGENKIAALIRAKIKKNGLYSKKLFFMWLSLMKAYILDFNPTKRFIGTPHVSSFILLLTKLFELL